MAELAAGAVSSLLGVIRNEALLLRGVRDDVQFIKEEMESMNSFLAHLARSAPPGGEHDEQVRTWMNQVRLLAQDCNNCIDFYLYRGNPDVHRARAGLRRYLWWVPWFIQKLAAQHRAALQLGQLKERARDVGERRLRYGVEVPSKSVAGQSPYAFRLMAASTASPPVQVAAGGYAAGDDEEDDDDQHVAAVAMDHSGRNAFFVPRILEKYVKSKLLEWLNGLPEPLLEWSNGLPEPVTVTSSIAIVAPDTDPDALALAYETLVFQPDWDGNRRGYHRALLVDIPAMHPDLLPLRPKEVLYYILHVLKFERPKPQSQKQATYQGGEEDLDSWQVYKRKFRIYIEKKGLLDKIKRNVKNMKIYEKLDKIKSDIQARPLKGQQKKGMDQLDPDVLVLLHQLLWSSAAASQQDQMKNKDMPKLLASDDTITKIANKLKKHMEADEGGGAGEGEGEKEVVEEKEHEEGGEKKVVEEKEHQEGGGEGGGEKEVVEEKEHEEVGGGEKVVEEKEHEKERPVGGGEKVVEEKEHEEKGGGEKEVGVEKEHEEVGGGEKVVEEKEHEEQGGGGKEVEEEEGGGEEEEEEEEEEDDDDDDDSDDDDDDDDDDEKVAPIHLHEVQYAHILRQVFPKTSSSKPLQGQQEDRSATKQTTNAMLGEDQIKQMIRESKQEILRELQNGKHDKNQGMGESGTPGRNTEIIFEEIEQKMDKIKHEFKEQLKIKGLVDNIKDQLEGECPLFILKVDETMDLCRWEDTRNALSLLKCNADVLIVTTTKDIQQAKEYCYPPREPIDYSLVGLYYDTVLEITSQLKNEDNHNPQIFRSILEECEPHEFCMKIFTHALYINPKRSNEELIDLHRNLQASPKSFDIIAKKMFKFSYCDLPKEYKSCLLYLAIFPPGYKIRRSTLIGRWVAEGLIFKEDWPSSVRRANRCFDELIDRWLAYPADIGATGKVNCCVVGDLVHGFITKIARKQHIVEARLSRHLAHHFSIFNDLQLRSSDRIDTFFQRLSKSSRVSLLKVLDLEGCQCFGGKNQRYLKDICSKMLLLKYLSLRGTDITQLPNEINNLRELEVLDIRQTKVPVNATENVLLLKLKRLIAGHTDRNPSNPNTGTAIKAEELVSSVQIPHRIEKMVNMEVLSNVKARNSQHLTDIGKLCHLRKLSVDIDDKNRHLKSLLRAISDLHECLCSLSIILPIARSEGTPSSEELPADIGSRLMNPPKHLESLSISGTTQRGHLLPLFAKDVNNKLVKVTLSSTSLNQDNLRVLAKLQMLRCIKLRHKAYTERKLTFMEGEFKNLRYFLVEGPNMTDISFEDGASCHLEKIALSFTNIESIDGVDGLKNLEEVELSCCSSNNSRLISSFNNAKQIAKMTLCGTLLDQGDLQSLANNPNIRCLVLLDKSCEVSQITFRKDEFPKLNHLIVHCSTITNIVFNGGSAPKLEKIIWSFTSLSGINNLPRLKELEFNGDLVDNELKESIKKHKNEPTLKHNKPEIQDQAKGHEQEDDDDGAARFSFCFKNQV